MRLLFASEALEAQFAVFLALRSRRLALALCSLTLAVRGCWSPPLCCADAARLGSAGWDLTDAAAVWTRSYGCPRSRA